MAFPARALPALLLLALAALPALPPASAQLPGGTGTTDARITMELQDPGAALVPGRPYALTLVVHYTYGPGGVSPPDQAPCADLQVVGPPVWAEANVTPPRVCFPIDPTFAVGGQTVTNQSIVGFNITGPAPALEPASIVVRAQAPAQAPFREATGEVNRTVVAGFLGRLAVQAPGSAVVAGGRAEGVAMGLENLGNGPMEVRFRNASAPPGVRLTLPERLTLQPGERREVRVGLQTPWTTPVRGPVQFQVETAHPSRPDLAGDNPRVAFEVEGRAAVPGWEPWAVLGAAALARALARRRA